MKFQVSKIPIGVNVIVMAVSILLLTACTPINPSAKFTENIPEWESDINIENINEPSGIVYHPGRGTLFVVGDEGALAEITLDGEHLQHNNFLLDLEGITVNPYSGYLYLAIEGGEIIMEIEPESLSILRQFQIVRTYRGEVVLPQEGAGIEAITYIPSAAGQQFDKLLLSYQIPPFLFEIRLPSTPPGSPSEILEVTIDRIIPTDGTTITGLHYDENSEVVVAVSDIQKAIYIISVEGDFIAQIEIQGREQEGITLDPFGHLYIAQDSGEIFKYYWTD